MKKLILFIFLLIFVKEVQSQSMLLRKDEPKLKTQPLYFQDKYKQPWMGFGIRINLWTGKLEPPKYFIYRERNREYKLPIYWTR